jgi:hypothetical protein
MLCDDKAGNHFAKLSDGTGTFKQDLGKYKTGWCSTPISTTQWADINGDGKADMICDDTAGSHWAMLSNGDGSFSRDVGKFKEGWCSHSGSYTQWADFNGDGKYDMMCDDSQGSHWSILTAVGSAEFALGEDLGKFKEGWCGHEGARTSWADVNGDG